MAIALAATLAAPALSAHADDLFVVRSSTKTPHALAVTIKRYAAANRWLYIGKVVKKGQVTLIKLCVPAIGKEVWPVGMRYSAMLPCGNFSVYRERGATRISMLNPEYMNRLVPNARLKKAGEQALPLFTKMLDATTR